MKRWNRLTAGLLCAVLAAALILPVSAHGCHGRRGRGHHGGCAQVQSVQTEVTVCPYEECAFAGRHYHDSVAYCGYAHGDGVCDGYCRALCPLEDCHYTGRHFHGRAIYCGASHDCGFCDGSCLQTS